MFLGEDTVKVASVFGLQCDFEFHLYQADMFRGMAFLTFIWREIESPLFKFCGVFFWNCTKSRTAENGWGHIFSFCNCIVK